MSTSTITALISPLVHKFGKIAPNKFEGVLCRAQCPQWAMNEGLGTFAGLLSTSEKSHV